MYSSYLDLHSDGAIDFGFISPSNRCQLPTTCLFAHFINVARASVSLRNEACAPDAEYGLEVELIGLPAGSPIPVLSLASNVTGFNEIGEIHEQPLTLPTLSLGPIGELDSAITVLFNDICDACGARFPAPFVLEVSKHPSHWSPSWPNI
jgi:hypothetical protein